MPYATPLDHHDPDLPPLKLRRHRRSRSASAANFTDERGPGAFAPISKVPRHKSPIGTRAIFHFSQDESDSSDETSLPASMNALGLTVDTKNVPANFPSDPLVRTKEQSTLPFPSRGSPGSSPLPPPSPSPSSASIPRTPSTPIILSNGKPLKPSLKSSQSSPNVVGLRLHQRAQSEPATPAGGIVKNVHFAGEESLRSVRVFSSSGKPVSVSKTGQSADETETETEYDSSSVPNEPSSYPFPNMVSSTSSDAEPIFELDTIKSSPVPSPDPPRYVNVHFETALIPKSRPPMLRGSILVRNIAFTKDVAVRFTLDDWQTTSEVICKHVVSLPSLPPPFPTPSTPGDRAASHSTGGQSDMWDRFSFAINLEDFERRLQDKTLWLVVRYTVPGSGEWWDNNNGMNYRINFKKSEGNGAKEANTKVDAGIRSPVVGNSQQRTFSAPSTLKGTPTTEAAQAAAHGTHVPLPKITLPTANVRAHRPSMPARPSPPIRHNSSPQPLTLASMQRSQSVPQAYQSVPTKLSLLNYAAPSSRTSSNASTPRSHTITFPSESKNTVSSLIGGMPATAPGYDYTWPPSTSSSSQSISNSSPPPSYSMLPQPSESEKQHMKDIASTSSLPTDQSYAALLKQWCFVQSPTPSPSQETPLPTPTPNRQMPAWRGIGMGMDNFNGLYGGNMRSDSPMLASM